MWFGEFECRRDSIGGAEGADGWSLGRGLCPFQNFFSTFSFKIVHLDAFWSMFYANCNCHYDVHDIKLKLHMLNSGAKGRFRPTAQPTMCDCSSLSFNKIWLELIQQLRLLCPRRLETQMMLHKAHCVKTWRLPQNRKYITYRNVARGHRVRVTVSTHKKIGKVQHVQNTTVQSVVLLSPVVCLSVCLSVCNVGGSWPHRLKILDTNSTNN